MLAAIVAASLAGGIQPAHATYPGSNDGRIAFGVDPFGGAQADVHSVLPNGRAARRLTDSPAADFCAAYPPDGKQIAFCSNRTGAFEIWKMKHNGKQEEQVTRLGRTATFPDFSPDARKVVFNSAFPGGLPYVYVVDSDGASAPVRLTNTPAFDAFPAYSPDGRKIAFTSNRTGVDQVWLMDADGSNQRQLTFDPLPKGQVPDWSPDGRKLAYQAATSGNGDIWVMNADGSAQTRLTTNPAFEYGPAWSPTGARIAFVRPRGHTVLTGANLADRDIWVMDADGSDAYVLHQGSRVPGWQPRGKRLHSPSGSASRHGSARRCCDSSTSQERLPLCVARWRHQGGCGRLLPRRRQWRHLRWSPVSAAPRPVASDAEQ